MKTGVVSLLFLLLLSSANLAQDLPADAKKVDAAQLMARFLNANADERIKLRLELIKLPTEELQAAIAGIKFDKPDATGVLKTKTKCPDGFERPYWVYLPDTYDPAKSYPLFVLLHGGVMAWPLEGGHGGKPAGEYMVELYRDAMPEAMRKECILLGCSAGVPETNAKAAWWCTEGQLNVLHMVREVKNNFNIDDDRVVVSGLSDGGSGTFGFAYRMPDTFAGFYSMIGMPTVPMADGTPVWFENLKYTNIYAFNGGKDPLYPGKRVKPLIEQAKTANAYIHYWEYADLGHEVGPVIERELKSYYEEYWPKWKRNLFPELIDWTCTSTERGQRAWLHVSEIMDLGKSNAHIPNVKIQLPAPSVRIGINIVQDSAPPKVESVAEKSLAERAGIKAGDEVIKLDDKAIATLDDLFDALQAKSPGDAVTIVVKRGGEEVTIKETFDKAKPEEAAAEPLTARVEGFFHAKEGYVMINVRNVGKVRLQIHPKMLKGNSAEVYLRSGQEGMKTIKLDFLSPVNSYILRRFEETGDRKIPYICQIEIDVAKELGLREKPEDE